MNSKHAELRSITERLIRSDASIGEQIKAAESLAAFFAGLTDVGSDSRSPDDRTPTELSGGVAVGPWAAARCVSEFRRTRKFITGTLAAVNDLLDRFPDTMIEVVYAGCGPFGTIFVPVLTLVDRERINVTFIDIHQRSLESVRTIISEIGFAGDNIHFVETDAAGYVHPRRPHLVVSETMQNALQKEMQVPISLNLGSQVEDGGVFVPAEITVDAIFAKPFAESFSVDGPKSRIRIGSICRFDPLRPDAEESLRRPVRLEIPANPGTGYRVALSTSVRVYGDIHLLPRQSSITNHMQVHALSDLAESRAVEFVYEFGSKPGFRWRFIEE